MKKNKLELNENELEEVNGGMSCTNCFGNGQTYYAGTNANPNAPRVYTFSFGVEHKGQYDQLILDAQAKTSDPYEIDRLVMEALSGADWATAINIPKEEVKFAF